MPRTPEGNNPTVPGHPAVVALGWDRPVMAGAAEWIHRAFPPRGRLWDLADVTVVTQGGRAGRILEATLLHHAEAHALGLVPPMRLGPGEIADGLIDRPARVASPIVRHLAWDGALRELPAATIEPFIRRVPRTHAHRMALAMMLDRLHAELAGEMIFFRDVPQRASGMASFDEADRWLAAAAIQERYLELLSRGGWADASDARVRAIREGRILARTAPIILVGVVELPGVALAALEASGAPISALVCAPPDLIHRFDAWGRPTEWWGTERTIEIPESSIRFAEDPSDQGAAAIEAIGQITHAPSPDEVVIGVPDESVVPAMCRWLADVGAFGRSAAGTPASRTRPVRVVLGAADVAEDPSWAPLAAFVRHPDVASRIDELTGSAPWLAAMDDHYATRVPGIAFGSADHAEDPAGILAKAALDGAQALLGELVPRDPGDPASAPASAWCGHIASMLDRVMPPESEPDARDAREASEALEAIARAMDEIAGLGGSSLEPRITAADALRLIADHAGRSAIPEVPRDDAVDLVGWLELASDPARIVIVTGMNEGVVPASVHHDPVVPDGLRARLGLSSDARRLVRDSYLIEVIARQGRETRFISGRRTSEGDPLTPSRLVVRPSPEHLGARVTRCMSGARDPYRPAPLLPSVRAGASDRFPIRPVLPDNRELTSVSVTAFRAYIESPYLFYLTHVLRLDEATDAEPELTPAGFGTLVHDALKRFAHHDGVHATDAKRVESALLECLDAAAGAVLGPHPVVAARVQLELARGRLIRFAPAQAARRAAGWVIHRAEWSAPRPGEAGAVSLDVDGVSIGLRGTIDRIERHESTGEFAILDYKTGDGAPDPEATHRRGRGEKEWIDLQLPLYARLAAPIIGAHAVHLGYAVLPSDAPSDPFRFASWNDEERRAALERAAEIVRDIRGGRFGRVGRAKPRNPIVAALMRTDRDGTDDGAGDGGEGGA